MPPAGLSDSSPQLLKAFASHGTAENHRHTQNCGEFPGVYGDTLRTRFVHHVQSDSDGQVRIDQLQGQEQILLKPGGIDYIHHDARRQNGISCYAFLVIE